MQKTLRKPENWQDFESLCKKLWGEAWSIPHKIKKNGRLGQAQAGVDIYGIPLGEDKYWGIQAKGKDDYSEAKLTEKEIEQEINKAKDFKPSLGVYIIASTTNKDAKIEEFVRMKDIQNQSEGYFEILLYCWEDIVDLIEENRETFNWYLGINNYRENYDFKVYFKNDDDIIKISPQFLKIISKYRSINPNFQTAKTLMDASKHFQMLTRGLPTPLNGSNEINKSWCSLNITIKNTGNVTIENWYLKLKIDNAKKISDNFYIDYTMSDQLKNRLYESRTLWALDDTNEFLYEPVHGEPLIQKSIRTFEISFIPHFNQSLMEISWELLARDYDKSGKLQVKLDPVFKEEIKYVQVDKDEHFKEDSIEIKDLIEKRK